MLTRTLAKTVYGFAGAVYLLAGVSVLLLGTGLLPGPVRDLILDIADGNPNSLHILQEFGSLLVFTGLITFWFLWHYEESRPFHWAMTVFWGLFALVHWVDVRGSFQFGIGPLINTAPFGLFLLIGLLRLRSEGKRGPAVPLAASADRLGR
jgi:hypothetical protein